MTDLRPQGYEAHFFDWDGTLADTADLNFRSLRESLRSVQVSLSRGWFDRNDGLSPQEMIESLVLDLDSELLRSLLELRRNFYLAELDRVRPISVMVEAVWDLVGRLPIALATGGPAATVLPSVRKLGLAEAFDVIVTRDDVAVGKPAPDVFVEAARRLGVDPRMGVAYEDSAQGVAAALAAGMDVVNIRHFVGSAMPPGAGGNRA